MTLIEYIQGNNIIETMTMRGFFNLSLGWEGLGRPYTRNERMEAYKEVQERNKLDALRNIHRTLSKTSKAQGKPMSPNAVKLLNHIIERDDKYWRG